MATMLNKNMAIRAVPLLGLALLMTTEALAAGNPKKKLTAHSIQDRLERHSIQDRLERHSIQEWVPPPGFDPIVEEALLDGIITFTEYAQRTMLGGVFESSEDASLTTLETLLTPGAAGTSPGAPDLTLVHSSPPGLEGLTIDTFISITSEDGPMRGHNPVPAPGALGLLALGTFTLLGHGRRRKSPGT